MYLQCISSKEELNNLKRDSLYLYGAGKLAGKALDCLGKDNISGVLVSDINNNPKMLKDCVPVLSVSDDCVPRSSLILIAVSWLHRVEIVQTLRQYGYTQIAFLSDVMEREFYTDDISIFREECMQMLWRVTPQPMLKGIVVNIVDHCNLNCAGCDHFSSIAQERIVSVERLRMDLSRMQELLSERVGDLRIMGGEPLLHPELEEILLLSKELFPKNQIKLYTNGIRLKQMQNRFWEVCRNTDTIIKVTKYPIAFDYEEQERMAESQGVRYEYYAGGETVKTLYHIPLDLQGKQDPVMNFMSCFHAVECITLSEGRLYPCTIAPNLHIFNQKYDTSIPLTEADGIDIYKVQSGEELLERLCKPLPVCRFCNIKKRSSGHEWHTTRGDIGEWS